MKMEDKFKMYDSTEEEKDVETQEVQEEQINDEVNEVEEQSEIEESENVEDVTEEQVEVKEETPIIGEKETKEEPTKENTQNNDKSKLAIMILAIAVLIAAIVAVVIPQFTKKEEEKTIVTDKQEVKSEYKLKGNHLQDFDIKFLQLENGEKNDVASTFTVNLRNKLSHIAIYQNAGGIKAKLSSQTVTEYRVK
jgi:hypothetical protein